MTCFPHPARVLLILLLCSLACGRKASPRPPEDVLPQPLTSLQGTNVPAGIRLSWSRPSTYVDGRRMLDLGGFVIERALGTDPEAPFRRLTVLEVSDRDRFRQVKRFRYVDQNTTRGMQYRYRVVSFTTDRYFSAPSNTVTLERTETDKDPNASFPTPGG